VQREGALSFGGRAGQAWPWGSVATSRWLSPCAGGQLGTSHTHRLVLGPPAERCRAGRQQEQPVLHAHLHSAPPTHAESEPVREAPLGAGKTPRPQRPAPAAVPPRVGSGPGCGGEQPEGAPFRNGQDPADPMTHTLTGLCRAPHCVSCLPVMAAYSLEGALLPKVSSLQSQNVPAGPGVKQCLLHSLPTPAGLGCELVIRKHIVPGELSWSTSRVVSDAWNLDPREVPRCHQAS